MNPEDFQKKKNVKPKYSITTIKPGIIHKFKFECQNCGSIYEIANLCGDELSSFYTEICRTEFCSTNISQMKRI